MAQARIGNYEFFGQKNLNGDYFHHFPSLLRRKIEIEERSQEEETASPVKTVLGSLSRASAPIHLVSIKTNDVGFA